jgi:hypothetical protein
LLEKKIYDFGKKKVDSFGIRAYTIHIDNKETEKKMGKFLKGFGVVAGVFGFMMLAGAAGDCDGKCGPGNDIPTMLMIIGYGILLIGGGVASFVAGQKIDNFS